MIKCDVNVCGVVSRNAAVKKDNDGKEFFVFGLQIPVKNRQGDEAKLEISVSNDGGKAKAAIFTTGKRVAVSGTMTVLKRKGKIYYNLRSEGDAELTSSKAEDNIDGTMTFRGKIGGKKGVEIRTDKNDKEYKVFAAFSSDKQQDGDPEFTWVNFLYFNPKDGEDFLQANAYIEAKGRLELSVFKGDVTMECHVQEVKRWELEKK